MQVKKQQLKPNMEYHCSMSTGSKLGKEYDKAVYCHSSYLTYMQSTSCEMLGWMNHKLESRLLGQHLRYVAETILIVEHEEELKELLMKVKEESEEAGLKLTFKKLKSWHPIPSLHGK